MVMNNKVLFHLEACFDLISRSSLHMKIQIMGRKINENLGFKLPLRKVNFFYTIFTLAAAYVTDQLCTKNGNSSIFKSKIRGL